MSHHLTVIINNGFLSTLLGVHIGSTRVALREREFQWHLPGIRWGGIISWAHFSSCGSFHPTLFVIAKYFMSDTHTKNTNSKKNCKSVGSILQMEKPSMVQPSRSGICLGLLQSFMQVILERTLQKHIGLGKKMVLYKKLGVLSQRRCWGTK